MYKTKLMSASILLSPEGEAQGNGVDIETDDSPANVLGEKDGIQYVKHEFKVSRTGDASPITGFGFASPSFANVTQMIEHFNGLCIAQNKEDLNGDKIVLDLAMGSLLSKQRIRVKAATPSVGDAGFKTENDIANYFDKKSQEDPEKLLFSIDDASQWIPGIRELSKTKQRDNKLVSIKELIAKIDKEKGIGMGAKDPEVSKLILEMLTQLM